MEEKETLIKAFKGVSGRYPANLLEILNVLVHPSVVQYAKAYIQVNDHTPVCQKYQYPWNCIKETEAIDQTVNNGWGGNMDDLMINWCVKCRARLFGDETGGPVPIDSLWLEEDPENEDEVPAGRKTLTENPWILDDPDPCMRDVDGCGD